VVGGGEREADAWTGGNLPRWSFAACVAGALDSFSSHMNRLGLAGYSIALVTWIFIGTVCVSNFSLQTPQTVIGDDLGLPGGDALIQGKLLES
jgi:hypothetical protein